MKIECIKEKLSAALAKAEKITSKNPTLPVLACVVLEADSQNLTIRSTNLDSAFEIEIPVKSSVPGKVAVPGMIFSSFINSLKEKSVTLETKEGNLLITTDHHQTTIKALSYEDFPTTPKVESKNSFSVPARAFLKALRSVSYSASISSVKPELASVYIYGDGDFLYFVSTDSFRLAEKRLKLKEAKDVKPMVVPIKNVNDIIKVFDDSEEDIKVSFEKNQISLSTKSMNFVSRLVDAPFPNYKDIIPKNPTTETTLLKQDLVDALKTLSVFSDKFNQANVKINPAKKSFILASKSNDIGESQSSVDAAASGEPIDMNFNHRYIGECLQSIESDALSLSFSGTTKPLVVRGVSDSSFTYLVMPMNR
jgi:DNA polymerase-3 subunit beta